MNVERSVPLVRFLRSMGLPVVLAEYIERYGPKNVRPEDLTFDHVSRAVDWMQWSEAIELAKAMGFLDMQKMNADTLRADLKRKLLLDFSFAVNR
jgi:hypothetical protein